MADCCADHDDQGKFTAATARTTARRYQRRGVLRRERDLLGPVLAAGVAGATVLEIGGGVGQLQLALLEAGAARAVNVELSPHYEAAADALATAAGLRDRVTRHVGDAAVVRPGPADVVLLYRVVCCTDDAAALVDAALAAGPRVVAITLPGPGWFPRLMTAVGNGVEALRRGRFRMRLHDAATLLAPIEAAGLRVVHDHQRPYWRTVVLAA